MSNEVIKHAAKALRDDWFANRQSKTYEEKWESLASASLSTIREPTPEMIAAGRAEFKRQLLGWTEESLPKIFQAMIAEMLK